MTQLFAALHHRKVSGVPRGLANVADQPVRPRPHDGASQQEVAQCLNWRREMRGQIRADGLLALLDVVGVELVDLRQDLRRRNRVDDLGTLCSDRSELAVDHRADLLVIA